MDTTYYVPVGLVLLYFGYRNVTASVAAVRVQQKPIARQVTFRRKLLYSVEAALGIYLLALGAIIFLSGLSSDLALTVEPVRSILTAPYQYLTQLGGRT